tara:strand:- start:29177 stop:29569 length:393 start_codon:yes stop_codon:yes gene_type:complete
MQLVLPELIQGGIDVALTDAVAAAVRIPQMHHSHGTGHRRYGLQNRAEAVADGGQVTELGCRIGCNKRTQQAALEPPQCAEGADQPGNDQQAHQQGAATGKTHTETIRKIPDYHSASGLWVACALSRVPQ